MPYTFFKHRRWHGKIRRTTVKRDACSNYWLYIITDYTNMKRLPTTGLLKLAIAYSFTMGGRADNYSGRCLTIGGIQWVDAMQKQVLFAKEISE